MEAVGQESNAWKTGNRVTHEAEKEIEAAVGSRHLQGLGPPLLRAGLRCYGGLPIHPLEHLLQANQGLNCRCLSVKEEKARRVPVPSIGRSGSRCTGGLQRTQKIALRGPPQHRT
jgi:hypothetical protein